MAELRYFLTPLEVEPDGNRHVPFWRTRVQRDRPAATSIGIQPFGARDFAIAAVYAETADLNAFAAAGAIELPRSGRITLAKLNAIRTMLGLAYVPPVLSANTDGLQVIRSLGVVAQLCQRIRGRFGSRMEDADRTRFNELGGIWAPLKDIADARDRLDAAVALWADRPIYTGGIDLGYGLPLAGGAIPATQSFTASNGTTLPTVDSRWVDTGGGTWDVLSNQAEVPDDSTETGVAFNDPDTIANHIGIVDIVASGNYTGGAGARHATGANTYYTFYGEVGGNCFLYDISGTSGTELFAGSSCALNDELGCSAVGSTIKGWKNGLEITSVTDSTWTTGFTGMAGWANISPRLDNFEAYNIPITALTTTTGTSSGQTHNPGTGVTPKAVVAFMFGSTDATDRVSSISYGGVAMTRVPTNGFAQDTAGEPCAIVCYTLLSSIPTGSQSVTYSATGTQRLTVVSFDSVWSALEIKASGKQEGDAANPSITLDSSTDQATRILGVMSGGAALTPNGYAIELSDQALSGAFACWVGHHIMAKTGSAAISATATSDDVAAIAIAIGESTGGGGATGTISATLPNLEAAATGAQTITGTVAATLPGLDAAVTGAMQPSGTVDATLPSLAAAAVATQTITGTIDATLPNLEAAAAGTQTITGTVAATLPGLDADATGVMQPSGTIAATLPSLTAAAAGAQTITGTIAATLPNLEAAVTGAMQPSGTIAATLPSLQAEAAGTHGAVTTGTIDATLPNLEAAAVATQTITGTIDATLPNLETAATGVMQPSGTIAATLPSLTAAATGTQTITGTIAATLPNLEAAVSGAAGNVFTGTIAATLPNLEAAAVATQTITGTIAATAPSLTAAVVGVMQPSGTIAATLPSLVAALAGSGGADIHAWIEVTVSISPALELGVTTQPALEIDTEFNG